MPVIVAAAILVSLPIVTSSIVTSSIMTSAILTSAGRPRSRWRQARIVAVFASAALLVAACGGPKLPDTVIVGSAITMAWSNSMAGTNTASVAGATPGGFDVSALTRSQFAEDVDGSVVVDEEFGSATISDPEDFTVRYDLTEPAWSDGIPLDAADLLLAWAASSNALAADEFEPGTERDDDGVLIVSQDAVWFDSVRSGLRYAAGVPTFDEFDRWIEVPLSQPIEDWQTALNVAVPAHVVGQVALGIGDPMEAKQAVITAITDRDERALASISAVWNSGFLLGSSSAVPANLLLSSGPYRVARVDQSEADAQQVDLVVNTQYQGSVTGEYEHISLTQTAADPLELIGNGADIVQLEPTDANWEQVRDLERTDYLVTNANTGRYWVLVLRGDRGDFAFPATREAFLDAVPRQPMTQAGMGLWRTITEATDVLLFPPSSPGYAIAQQDSGFSGKFGLSGDDAIAAREAAGVPAGTGICVLYDTDSPFAAAAFAALQTGTAEIGWAVQDCGAPDVAAGLGGEGWEAVLTTVAVPQTSADIAAQWGSGGSRSLSHLDNEARDALIAQLATTTDQYEARDLRVQIEASIVAEAVALPLVMETEVTIADRGIGGVQPRPGPFAQLTSGALDWTAGPA